MPSLSVDASLCVDEFGSCSSGVRGGGLGERVTKAGVREAEAEGRVSELVEISGQEALHR